MKRKILLLLLIPWLAFGQTSTVTVNTSTKVTQPPVGKLTLDGATNFFLTRGTGTPNGSVTATSGSIYCDLSGGFWIKTSGTGNTGWQQTSVGGAVWGSITGTLSSQTDLQAALDAKQNSLTFGNLTDVGTDGITVTGGTGAVIGSGTSLSQHVSDGTHNGYLSSTDWTSFNGAVSGAGVSSWNSRTGAVVLVTNDYSEAQLSFTDITTNNTATSAHGFMPKLTGDISLFFNGAGEQVAIPGSGSGVSQLISGGGVAWTGVGFNYVISAAVYTINGVQYSSTQTSVTLAAADATQDRIDVFYVDSSGLANKITGTPGTPPVQPSVDPGTQLSLTFAYVVAASTEPVITNVNIYLENTEYTMSTNSAGTINLASTNNPFAGTKDIEGTATVSGNLFTALKPSGTLDLSQYTQLTFQIRSKAAWPNAKSISIFWMNGASVVGSSVALKQGTFGFDSSNTSSYQQIVVPAANFGTGTTAVDRLRMSVAGGGGSIGWYIDNIILQAGGGGGGGGGTVTSFASGNLSPLFTTTVTNPTTAPVQSFSLSTAAAHTFLANDTGSTAAPSYTSFAEGTNYLGPTRISDTAYGSSWNAVTTIAPSKNAVYDEIHLFDTADNGTIISAGTGFRIGGVAASRKILVGNGTNFIASTETYAVPGSSGNILTSDGTNWTSAAPASSGAPADAHYVTTQAESGLSAEFNLGGLTSGLLYHSVSGSVSTPATVTIASDLNFSAPTLSAAHSVTLVVDGSGSVLTTGTKNPIKIPFGGTLQGWLLVGSPSGSVTVDIYRAADGAGLPITSIIGGSGTKPALSSAVENSSTSFTSWTSTTLTAKDNLAINLSGITTSTYCALTLYFK